MCLLSVRLTSFLDAKLESISDLFFFMVLTSGVAWMEDLDIWSMHENR